MEIRPDTLSTRHDEFLLYVDFIEYYVSAVIGLRHFEKMKCHRQYREYVTVSDEAFASLTIENNWQRWMDMAEQDAWKTSPVPTKWTVTRDRTTKAVREDQTNNRRAGEPQARRYRGWSAQGIERYNQLFDQINAERETQSAKIFETKLLKHFQHQASSHSKAKKKASVEVTPLPMARHQLWVRDTIVTNNVIDTVPKSMDGNHNDDDEESEDDDDDDKLPNYAL